MTLFFSAKRLSFEIRTFYKGTLERLKPWVGPVDGGTATTEGPLRRQASRQGSGTHSENREGARGLYGTTPASTLPGDPPRNAACPPVLLFPLLCALSSWVLGASQFLTEPHPQP